MGCGVSLPGRTLEYNLYRCCEYGYTLNYHLIQSANNYRAGLWIATKNKHNYNIIKLTSLGVYVTDYEQELWDACYNNNINLVKKLLPQRKYLHEVDQCLVLAVENNSIDLQIMAIEYGARSVKYLYNHRYNLLLELVGNGLHVKYLCQTIHYNKLLSDLENNKKEINKILSTHIIHPIINIITDYYS
jgi:hypothetical protein